MPIVFTPHRDTTDVVDLGHYLYDVATRCEQLATVKAGAPAACTKQCATSIARKLQNSNNLQISPIIKHLYSKYQ